MKDLRVVLIQNGTPVAFASKALAQAQANYSNLERECLAVIHGIQRFHHYLFGKAFTVTSDHKPLEMIFQKPVHAAPPKLQRMMVKVHGYDTENINVDMMNFSSTKQGQIRHKTARDSTPSGLSQVIFTGWPNTIKEVPNNLREFWDYRDELAVENGVVFKGKQVLIPEPLRSDIHAQLHERHQGIEKTRRLACESVFWPRINKDIENIYKS